MCAHNTYEIVKGSGEDWVTVLITVSRNNDIAPSFIVHACAPLRKDIVQNTPDVFRKSENGCMTSETIYEFITNTFNPWLLKNDDIHPICSLMVISHI